MRKKCSVIVEGQRKLPFYLLVGMHPMDRRELLYASGKSVLGARPTDGIIIDNEWVRSCLRNQNLAGALGVLSSICGFYDAMNAARDPYRSHPRHVYRAVTTATFAALYIHLGVVKR